MLQFIPEPVMKSENVMGMYEKKTSQLKILQLTTKILAYILRNDV